MLKCHNTLTQTQLSTNESVSTISVIYYESCDYCLYSVSVTEFSVCYPNFFFLSLILPCNMTFTPLSKVNRE